MNAVRTITTLVLLLAASSTMGGAAVDADLVIDMDNSTAVGNMTTVAYSKNDVELIGCGTRYISDGGGGVIAFAFCQAENAAGDTAFCSTLDPGLVAAVSSIGDHSFVTFSWNEFDECTRIGFSTQSFYLPKGDARKATTVIE